MTTKQKHILRPLLPLIIAIFIIAIILLLAFLYDIYKYPFWIKEGGVIESLSAIGYFLSALLILIKGKWSYIKKYHYFFILIIMFGLRELDFHKKFTTMGVFKIKFYLSSSVPIYEKLIGLLVISLILYIFIIIIKKHAKGFFRKVKGISPIHIGVLIIFLLLFFSKAIDGLARKLGQLNIIIEQQTSIHFQVIEEILELGIPLFIMTTLLMYSSEEKHQKLKNSSYNS